MPDLHFKKAPIHGDNALLRVFGFWALAASVVNLSIGASTFVIPGLLAASLGAAAPLAFILGAGVFLPVALCFAAAGSRIGETGGPYTYVRAAAGPLAGFLVASVFWISNAAGTAGIAAALVDQIGLLVPALAAPLPRACQLVGIYGALCAINALGARAGGMTVMLFSALKILPLIAVLAAGPWFIQAANLHGDAPLHGASLRSSLVIVIFAYSGLESALVPGGEFRNANRTVPAAALTGVALVVFLYIGLQVVAQGVLGSALASEAAPLARVGALIAPGGAAVILVTAGLAMAGCLQGDLLGSSRLLFALGRDGYLPHAFARVSLSRRVPVLAILAHAAAVAALAIGGTFESMASISGGAFCLVYLSVCLSAWRLQRAGISQQGTPFVLWGGPVIPLVACGGLTMVLWTLHAREWRAIALVLAVAIILYGVLRKRRSHLAANGVPG